MIRSIFSGLLLTLSASATAIPYTVAGSGTVSDFSQLGVASEVVTFSFTYDDADFAIGTEIVNGGRRYEALAPIPVTVFGTASGELSVDDISFVTAFDYTFDQWNFESGLNGLLQANNSDGTAFSSRPPASFTAANNIFVTQLTSTSLWDYADVISFGADAALTFGAVLMLEDIDQVRITAAEVPLPTTLFLMIAGLILLGASRSQLCITPVTPALFVGAFKNQKSNLLIAIGDQATHER